MLNLLSNDSDPDGDKLTITEINGQPVSPGDTVTVPNGTVTLNADGTVTFNPDPGYNGPVEFDYTVADPTGATDTAHVTLDVGGVNDAPTAVADVGSTDEDTALVVSAADGVIKGAGTDTDPDGDSLSVSAVSFGATSGTVGQPLDGAWGSLTLNADGSYTYTPNAAAQALDDSESQVDVFTYTVTDPSGLTSTTTLTLTVTGRNDAPVAIDDSATTPEDTPVTINVLGNDSDPDGEPLTITEINGQPVVPGTPITLFDAVDNPIGEVTLNPDGTLTFDPVPNYNGPVDFTYTVSDGTATDVGNVHIVVDDLNDPPTARDETVAGVEDAPVSFDPARQRQRPRRRPADHHRDQRPAHRPGRLGHPAPGRAEHEPGRLAHLHPQPRLQRPGRLRLHRGRRPRRHRCGHRHHQCRPGRRRLQAGGRHQLRARGHLSHRQRAGQ